MEELNGSMLNYVSGTRAAQVLRLHVVPLRMTRLRGQRRSIRAGDVVVGDDGLVAGHARPMWDAAGDHRDLTAAKHDAFSRDREFDLARMDDCELFLRVLMNWEDATRLIGVPDDSARRADDLLAGDAGVDLHRLDVLPAQYSAHADRPVLGVSR